MTCSGQDSSMYALIPKGIGFHQSVVEEPVDHLVEMFKENIPDEDRDKLARIFHDDAAKIPLEEALADFPEMLELERQILFQLYDYESARYNDMKDALYLKPLFILLNLNNRKVDGLNMLLADQDTLFTYTDAHYRHERINSENIRAWNPLFYNAQKRKECYNSLSVWSSRKIAGDKKAVCIGLLDKIYASAARKHQRMSVWIKKAISENYDPENFELYDRFDLEEGIASLKKSFPEYENKISPELGAMFFDHVLPEYLSEVKHLSDDKLRPERLPIQIDRDTARSFAKYRARLWRLEHLHEHFKQELQSLLNLRSVRNFEVDCKTTSPFGIDLSNAILGFFKQRDGVLLKDAKGILTGRVNWAMSQKSVPFSLKPVFLTYMTICCNRNIVIGVEPPVAPENGLAHYDDRQGKPRQRYAQLILLEQLCDTLNVNHDERMQNWEQFLFWQGKEILSQEEAQFWRERLGNEYESLPAIGFQLCCVDYLQNCIPVHLDKLSYKTNSYLRRGGYSRFWHQNQGTIKAYATQLMEQNSGLVKRYEKFWKKPKKYFYENKQWLNHILDNDVSIDLSKFENVPKCDENELKRLILETEFQIAICENARLQLQKLCIHNFGLNKGLFLKNKTV